MAEGTKEIHLEDHIIKHLVDVHGFVLKDRSVYDKDLCLIREDLHGFLDDTQPTKVIALYKQYDAQTHEKIAERVSEEIRKRKTIDVFRENVKDRGQTLNLAYFKPVHSRNPEHAEWYEKNRFTVIRQLQYSKTNSNAIDLVLFLNGIPIMTIELKNALTGQTHLDAIKQYMRDRDAKETLLEFRRCLVHFAVGTEQVSMCTELKGKDTHFLPFNMALVNENPKGFATSYLWEEVLSKDSLLDLIQNYVNLQINKDKYFDKKTRELKEKESKVLIFPRYHQRRAVQKLIHGVHKDGVGQKYLVYHSAGSGKSNTIAWLAHRLSDFYQHPDDDKTLFSSVIVVTDRRVLNAQIQNTIRQFAQVPGVVAYIDKNKTSQDLKDAIESNKRIIITTLQKFPVISEMLSQKKDTTYAVIIDEAHSSQSGESARHLRKALSLEEAESADKTEMAIDELIEDEIKKKGNQPNISFFAFTATPKPKTIELFGTLLKGKKEPFDEYTMEQAIKEGFILDVLKNYMSWRRYYKIVKRSEVEDKEYDKKKTVRLLSSYVDLQDHAIEKKSRVMIEHFVSQTQKEIQGEARAMVVTRSRLHAVRFKRKFDDVMREMKLPYSALVAFSGTVTDAETGEDYTMENMNNLGGKFEIPEAFKLPQYRILIVANMFQTGFDEPLLHTMFVDKKLGGANTVQTLSRLNRTKNGKDSTMILDFVNDPEMIQKDFQEYYGGIYMDEDDQTDPNSLYDVLHHIEDAQLIHSNELEVFAGLFFKPGDHKELLQPILAGIVKRYNETLDDDQKVDIKAKIKTYIRLYRFLSQIISFSDVQLEKYYVLLSALMKVLPVLKSPLPWDVLGEIGLDSYKLQHQYTTDLGLVSESSQAYGMTPDGGGKKPVEEMEWLTKIIKVLNETYGLDLKQEDKVEFERMKTNIYANEELMSFFNQDNTKANIQDKFNEEIDNELLNFINTKLELYNKLTEDKVNLMFKRMWFNDIYDKKVRGLEA